MRGRIPLAGLVMAALLAMPVLAQIGTPETAASADEATQAEELNARGVSLYSNGKYAEALPLFEQVLRIRERVLGKEHPQTLISVNNLAALYDSQG